MNPKWPDGPWDNEPDHVTFEVDGLLCILHRVPGLGHWCGYVAVPPSHKAHGRGIYDVDVNVHGGLTYARPCQGAICHVPKPGESDSVWWLGFDCAHYYDASPTRPPSSLGESYRTLNYVCAETESLARQLKAMATS